MKEKSGLSLMLAVLVDGSPDPDYADSWCAAYRLTCGSTLHISQGQHDRLEISTSVPRELRGFRPYYRDGEAPKNRITVSAQKPAAQIVGEVRRRLLPEHERLFADCASAKQKNDDHHASVAARLTAVANACGGTVRKDHDGHATQATFGEYGAPVCLEAKCSGEGIKLEIETDTERATKIAALCQQLSEASVPDTEQP